MLLTACFAKQYFTNLTRYSKNANQTEEKRNLNSHSPQHVFIIIADKVVTYLIYWGTNHKGDDYTKKGRN